MTPYSRNRVSPGAPPNRLNANGSGSRTRGVGSTGRNSGKFINTNYTPPVRKPYVSPAARSNGSNKGTPNVTMTNQNRLRRQPLGSNASNRSPSLASDHSRKSIKSSG